MPRRAGLDAPGTLDHVINRGIEGTAILGDEQDREHFLSLLSEITEAMRTRILT
jgi:putative transposase